MSEQFTIPDSMMSVENTLPKDWKEGTFVGRVWRADVNGPSVVKLDNEGYLVDITTSFPTVSALCEQENPAEAVKAVTGERIGKLSDILATTARHTKKDDKPYLLSPIDLHAVKAAGVTFAESLVERVVEKMAGGDRDKALGIRIGVLSDIATILKKDGALQTLAVLRQRYDALQGQADNGEALRTLGVEVAQLRSESINFKETPPGSKPALQIRDLLIMKFAAFKIDEAVHKYANDDPAAAELVRAQLTRRFKQVTDAVNSGKEEGFSDATLKEIRDFLSGLGTGAGKSYIEVGLGPKAEIFTKAQPMSSVGHGADAGYLEESKWNNPEPEVVLVTNSRKEIVGAALGNDVNHRDIEGMSELLLGECKDQNASCAVGPFIRLIDKTSFKQEDIDTMKVEVHVKGTDGFELYSDSSMEKISRKPEELVNQMFKQHQYPDGAVLFCGTMFSPVKDRDEPTKGFTHKVGDHVTIRSDKLGSLTNRMDYTQNVEPWIYGVGKLMQNLAERGVFAVKGFMGRVVENNQRSRDARGPH